jgi:hypothetical protein
MDLPEINRVMRTLENHVSHDDDWVDIRLTSSEYEEVFAVIRMLNVAEMTNYKTAQAAFPKLVQAVKLVLALDKDSREAITLESKHRAQLRRALTVAGEQDH